MELNPSELVDDLITDMIAVRPLTGRAVHKWIRDLETIAAVVVAQEREERHERRVPLSEP